jgi:hypothetical protein
MIAGCKWRDVLPIHPAADLFPQMSPDELKALGEDIKKNGLREQVKLISTWSKPPNGWEPAIELTNVLIDGRNRLDAMEAAGINLFRVDGQLEDSYFRPYSGKVIDPYAYVVSCNIHRRHLTAQQKREVIAKLIKAAPEKSNRQIAGEVKVSHPTVAAVRADLETKGDVVKVSTSVDSKGRKQQAHKPKKKNGLPAAAETVEADTVPPIPAVEAAPTADTLSPQGTLEERIDHLADQIQDVAQSLEPQDRAGFFEVIRQEIDSIENLLNKELFPAVSAAAHNQGDHRVGGPL